MNPADRFTLTECRLSHERLNRILDRLPRKARREVCDEVLRLYQFFEAAKGYAPNPDPPKVRKK